MKAYSALLAICNIAAAVILIIQAEALFEATEVAASSLPEIVEALTESADDSDLSKPDHMPRRAQMATYVEKRLQSNAAQAQSFRVVVVAVVSVLLVNSVTALIWFLRVNEQGKTSD